MIRMNRQITWKELAGNDLKLNWDAAIDAHGNLTGMGRILRDATGQGWN